MEENKKYRRSRKRKFYGEDSEIIYERKRDSNRRHKDSICDTHIDGA